MRPYRISAGDCVVLEKIGGVVHIIPIWNRAAPQAYPPDSPSSIMLAGERFSYPVPGLLPPAITLAAWFEVGLRR